MRIGIDARVLVGPTTGAGRVVWNLLCHLRNYPEHHFFVFHQKDFKLTEVLAPNVTPIEHNVSVATIRNLLCAGWTIRTFKLDAFYYPFVDVPIGLGAPTAAVVHDLYYWWDRKYFSSTSAARHLVVKALTLWRLRAADVLLPISVTTANQICRLPLLRTKRVRTVPLCVPPPSQVKETVLLSEPVANKDSPFFLYVGNNRKHKNLEVLIRAFNRFANNVSDWNLVMCGSIDPRYGDPREFASRFAHGARIVHLGHVSDDVLETLYRRADCVVIPSLYEGFGLPALEAAVRGKPVVCSDIDSLREVLDLAPRYCDPVDIDSWCEALVELARNPETRRRIAADCASRAELFSCERFGRETMGALLEIAKNRKCVESGAA